MADRMTKEQRHKCMASIRSKNTGPELAVRRGLHKRGFRFRILSTDASGTDMRIAPNMSLREATENFGKPR